MEDETTDSSNHKQVTLIFWHVSKELEVHEEFVGLYHTDSITHIGDSPYQLINFKKSAMTEQVR